MKKIICIVLALCFCPLFFGCKEKQQPATGQKTLMIYMVGSDLEAKGGAGTNDLEEIKKSGIDVSQTNVIIYAGGSKRWHNDDVDYEEGNPVIKLTSDGYEQVELFDSKSMGESEALSEFLKFAYEKYPAESFSLIMWDHGNGPLIGYGKDMLFDNDSLTLEEMRTAFENSPFKGDKKLEWIGFDACLMSSAELCCVLDDYAKYMVASQEVEPAFGWNYDVFGEINTKETEEFLTTLTEKYLVTCEEYYEESEYEPQDTTLALIDLSKASELEKAIENLFVKATADIDNNYNKITSSRVNSRAFGRATTGSEYDLIDLYDMAEQLKSLYSDEADAIQQLVTKMVIKNSTNAEKSCGISIYYPFYNKKYYEKSWGAAYEEIGVLEEYANYLSKYDDIWLGTDKLDIIAKSISPNAISDSKYTLELTEEQSDAYASASYYILQREGEELYTRIFSSKKVHKDGNTLTADFDGNIIYAKNDFDDYWIPVVEEHDTVGSITRYSSYVELVKESSEKIDEEEIYKSFGHNFHLAANDETKEISKSALIPYNKELDADKLMTGKQEEANLSEWTNYYFLHEAHKFIKREKNGVIAAYDKWVESDFVSTNISRVGDGVEFFFDKIPDGEYYLMFEIEDTQSSKYCSELLPITSSGCSLKSNYFLEPVEVNWNSGDKIKLFERENIEFYLAIIENTSVFEPGEDDKTYCLEVKNKNSFDIYISGYDLICNNNIYCEDASFGYLAVPANGTLKEEHGIDFGIVTEMDLLTKLDSIQFCLEAKKYSGEKTLFRDQKVTVNFSDQTSYIPKDWEIIAEYNKPVRDILATNQIVFNKDGLKGTLMGFGGAEESSCITAMYCFENNSDEIKYFCIDGYVFDGVYIEKDIQSIAVPAGTKVYYRHELSEYDLDKHMITSPSSASVSVRFMKYSRMKGGGGFAENNLYQIKLSKKGKGVDFTEGKEVIYNKKGVKVAIKEIIRPEADGDEVEIIMTVNNQSGQGIKFDISNITIIDQKTNTHVLLGDVGSYYGACGNGQKSIFVIYFYPKESKDYEISFRPVILNIAQEKELWEETQKVNFTVEIK